MAFRTDTVPASALQRAKSIASTVRNYCAGRGTEFQSETNRDVILATSQDLRRWRDDLAEIAATPGIADYASVQENDGTYDVVAEFSAMNTAIDAVIDHIVAAMPVSSNGFIEEKTLNADGTISFGTFTASDLSTLRGLLQTVVDGID